MVSEFDVKYVVRNHTLPTSNSITHIGGELSSGDRWQISVAEAVEGIRSGRFAFTVTRNEGVPEQLKAENHPFRGPLLKSPLDGRESEALLSLPEQA